MTVAQASDASRPGMAGAVAVIYALYGTGFLVAIVMGGTIQGISLGWPDAWLPALILAASVGVLRRARWGRWLAYVVSLPLLFGVPIGTILGGYMIWHLTKYRALFSKPY
jgi:hypothetical protein